MRFGYDLVNLDFDGGLGNRLGRVNALKKLLERQAGVDSLLFLTLNVRTQLHTAIQREIDGLLAQAADEDWRALVGWHARDGQGLQQCRLKAVVPALVRSFSAHVSLACLAHPPVVYEGHEKARMVHFAFELSAEPESFRAHSPQLERHLLELPMVKVADGALVLSEDQPPGGDRESWARHLEFLGEAERDALIGRPAV